MARFRVRWTAEVELTIDDEQYPDILTRTQTADWQRSFYTWPPGQEVSGPVEMIARCCGIDGSSLGRLDGWADLPSDYQVPPVPPPVRIHDVSFLDSDVERIDG